MLFSIEDDGKASYWTKNVIAIGEKWERKRRVAVPQGHCLGGWEEWERIGWVPLLLDSEFGTADGPFPDSEHVAAWLDPDDDAKVAEGWPLVVSNVAEYIRSRPKS